MVDYGEGYWDAVRRLQPLWDGINRVHQEVTLLLRSRAAEEPEGSAEIAGIDIDALPRAEAPGPASDAGPSASARSARSPAPVPSSEGQGGGARRAGRLQHPPQARAEITFEVDTAAAIAMTRPSVCQAVVGQ